MSGNRTGGQKAAATNKERHGDDFYVKRGRSGGSKITENTKRKGFGSLGAEAASEAGKKGGRPPVAD